jgi:hypothetical protein
MDQATIVERVKAAALKRVDGSRHDSITGNEIVESAKRRLQASPYFALRSISVDFHEGLLVLRGRVTSYYHKQWRKRRYAASMALE